MPMLPPDSASGRRETPPMGYDDLTMRIAIAWRDLRRIKPQRLSEPVPQGQLDTMDVISHLGSCSMVQLSNALRIDASTATRAVDRLVESGMAARRRSNEDARTVLVELTKEGRALERRLTRERMQQMNSILDRLPADDRGQVAAALEALLAATDAANHDEHPPGLTSPDSGS
jgi:DNA-binding MarR family transcriptional regulator